MTAARIICFLSLSASLQASDLDTIGVTLLKQVDPSLQGSGVKVAQVESPLDGSSPPPFEVGPAAVGQPAALFTWISGSGTSSVFTNTAGVESFHADLVGGNFYGATNGAAPQVNHVDNYEANQYINNVVAPLVSSQGRVVNQSFIVDPSFEQLVNTDYDNYAAQYGTLFVSGIAGVNNVRPICAPGTSYNGIGVSAYGAFNLPGPTSDGRCKPDIASPDQAQAPNGAVSYATAYASGAAAILVQAAKRGDGGANTNGASDLRNIKALLLNGAVKPAGWTNSPATPLDALYGAGIVNVFNSWMQLKGGQRAFIESTTVTSGAAHPPGANTNNVAVLSGWDTNSISTTTSQDRINHYYFKLTGTNSFTFTATLVWNKQLGKTSINDLNLFLYNTANSNLVASSISAVDNVEHLSLPQLAPGRYDLQVLKKGSATQVSAAETYALAFDMFNLRLNIARSNNLVVVSWPLTPAGFRLQSSSALNPASWTSVIATVNVDTNASRNVVTLSSGGANQFYRLLRPTTDFGL